MNVQKCTSDPGKAGQARISLPIAPRMTRGIKLARKADERFEAHLAGLKNQGENNGCER